MAQIVVRNIEDGVMQGLKELAQRHGVSAEEEVRRLIAGAVGREQRKAAFRAKAARTRTRLSKEGRTFEDSTALIRADRGR
jgi:plasmid stability protein